MSLEKLEVSLFSSHPIAARVVVARASPWKVCRTYNNEPFGTEAAALKKGRTRREKGREVERRAL